MVMAGVILGRAAMASAQLPVCVDPSPEQQYYTACAPGGRFLAANLLFDLAVDHVFKADSAPVKRRAGDILRSLVTDETLDKNDALRAYLDALEPMKLTKIDTTTGMLLLHVGEEQRRFAGSVALDTESYQVSWQLPERLAGGYWRTPGVLQIAFWEGQRAKFRIEGPSGIAVEAQIDCLVVSTDGIRVVTATGPHILVRFDQCG
jgi:hypothetical protein